MKIISSFDIRIRSSDFKFENRSRGKKSEKPFISFFLVVLFVSFAFLIGCKDTYTRANMKEEIRALAKTEYNLDVDVVEVEDTIGIQFRIQNMLTELTAEDQLAWKQMEDLLLVLSRVALSSDRPPEFMVLDVIDENNPSLHLYFTRQTDDLKRVMAGAIGRNDFLDRLLMEFSIAGNRIVFDPYEFDIVRLMMMAMDTGPDSGEDRDHIREFQVSLEQLTLPLFLSKVVNNTLRRIFREEKKLKKGYSLRKVEARFGEGLKDSGQFKVMLDLVTLPGIKLTNNFMQKTVLPRVANESTRIFKSYRFNAFEGITVIEKNSGKLITVVKK